MSAIHRPSSNPSAGVAEDVTDDPKWGAVLRRDAGADGAFVYSVESTGVYCRPSCPARRPRPERVAFHADADAAERAGYRACKRCRPRTLGPEAARAALVAELCRFIERSERTPSLASLASVAGLSAFHTHRVFKQVTGVTPRAYAAAQRAERARRALSAKRSVTEAMHEAGYGSSGRFYATSNARFGMAPALYRKGGEGLVIRFALAPCSLGVVLVAATERGTCAILLGDAREPLIADLSRRFPRARCEPAGKGFARTLARVVGLIEAPASAPTLPLDIRGTAFQQRVWSALRAVPPGRTATYTELARAIGAPRALRAVAGACAANPLAVAIPCHRAVRADGCPSGYRWGPGRKHALLEREALGKRREQRDHGRREPCRAPTSRRSTS